MRTSECAEACLIIDNLLRCVFPFEQTEEVDDVGVLS